MAKAKTKKPLKPGCVQTLQEIATLSGISYTSVRGWAKTQGFPVEPDGSYSIWEIATWRAARQPAPVVQNDDDETDRDELRKEIQNRLLLLKLGEKSGELVSRSQAKAEITRMFHLLRTRLEAIPDQVATGLPPDLQPEIAADWKRQIELLCREIANWSLDADS